MSGALPFGTGLAGAEAPEPHSRLGSASGIPSAEDAAWAWLEGYAQDRHGEVPEDLDFAPEQMVDAFIAGRETHDAEMIGALQAARDFLAGSRFESGVCCCGELISDHTPLHSNHAPRDEFAYHATILCERIAETLGPIGRGFVDWEHEPDEFDRQADEAIAAGAQSGETRSKARSEGRQSGGKAASPKVQP